MGDIFIAASVVGATGVIIGLILGVAGEKLEVEIDEREVLVRDALPGNNCGACGFPGCDGLAKAISEGIAPVNACPVGGAKMVEEISLIMGVEAEEKAKTIAYVKCSGVKEKTKIKYNYNGILDCRKVMLMPGGGDKACVSGCLGYGTCVRECSFDAINIINGVAVVDKEKCVSCGLCVKACPKEIIEIIPYESTAKVSCYSKEKGKDVKSVCEVGCIGCKLCMRVCESNAIIVENNLAKVDYEKCIHCMKCIEKCPTKIIRH